MKRHGFTIIATGLIAIVATGCSPESQLNLELTDFAIDAAMNEVDAGVVRVRAHNASSSDEHEIVLLRTDLAADQLPTKPDGSLEEDAPGLAIVDEIEDIAPGGTAAASFDLPAGKYLLLCNLVEVEEDGTVESHFALGMHTAIVIR